MRPKNLVLLLCVCILGLSAGCVSDSHSAQGKVFIDDKIAKNVQITFTDLNGTQLDVVTTDANGVYTTSIKPGIEYYAEAIVNGTIIKKRFLPIQAGATRERDIYLSGA
jgi:hypothetical protein